MKQTIIPESLTKTDIYQLMIGSIAPRPIAFVSSYNSDNSSNLAPYSFFMGISAYPPIVAFSAATPSGPVAQKDTLFNAKNQEELVINSVHYAMTRQMTLTSISFPRGTSEFDKSGLTEIPAQMVNAPMVKESHINLECKVKEIKSFGNHPGAGNLIICDVVLIHIDNEILTENGRIDPHKADLMGRMGRAFYTRASGESIYSFYQNTQDNIIGYDNLPLYIKESSFLNGNEIAELSRLIEWPDQSELDQHNINQISSPESRVKELIKSGHPKKALALLMILNEQM
jgi:flavin reductase (DIM6/NTAB) family NADH-FMN oxidoreductase RutF